MSVHATPRLRPHPELDVTHVTSSREPPGWFSREKRMWQASAVDGTRADIPHGSRSVDRSVLCVAGAAGGQDGLATSCSPEFGDLTPLPGQSPRGEQAAAHPTGFSFYAAQKHFGVLALRVGLVGESVVAGRRVRSKYPGRVAASNPGVVAGFEAGFATTVATAASSFKLRNLSHD
jgi:hypothetical protein